MNRRSFLQSILAAGVAPWVCTKAGVLMPVRQILAPGAGILISEGGVFTRGFSFESDGTLTLTTDATSEAFVLGGRIRAFWRDYAVQPREVTVSFERQAQAA